MCGIAGIVRAGQAVEIDLLDSMAQSLRHRGPEHHGHFGFENFGLAHSRLSIIDLPGGHQPLFDPARRHALVCNGEIYNYVELLSELQSLGASPLTHSDSEAALHGWAHWGQEGLQKLNGMYAFALLDMHQKQLWLVRDRLGIKPLYYVRSGDQLLFASEIKALLKALPSAPELNPRALAQFFQNQASSGRETVFQGVYRVLPGEAIRIDAELKLQHHRYWRAADIRPRVLSQDEALEEWEPLFAQVMKEHMRADVPFGVFLSGGVDSAILLGQLKQLHPHPIRSFSIGWKDARQADELDAAQRIAAMFGSEHESIRLSREAVFHRLPRAVWAADDLMRDYACLPTLALAQAASRELKVVFSGEGGDEAFAGYRRYRPDWIERSFKQWRYPGSGGFRARGELRDDAVRGLFIPELDAVLRHHREPFIEAWSETPPDWSELQRRQYVDLSTNLPDDLLVKADRMLMAASIEGRVPFVDHRVVEFGLSLPDALKIDGKTGKLFLKRWAERFLPKDHLGQKKTGFHVPVGEWLSGEFLQDLSQRLPRNEAIARWCKPAAVTQLLARQAKRADVTREIWSLLQFAIWHRLFVEGEAQPPADTEDPLHYV